MKKAIIVGASSGIGEALAKVLVNQGYQVGITGRRTELLEKLKAQNPSQFIVKTFDCTTRENAKYLEELVETLGGIDLLVLSSGIGYVNPTLKQDLEQQTVDLNVTAFTEIIGWTYRHFKQKGNGHFVGISSIAGIRGGRHAPAYGASKAYQINYMEGLRQKAMKEKLPIHFTDIQAGFVDTTMAKGDDKFWVATPQKAAKQIFNAIKRKKRVVYVSRRWRLIAVLLKILPSWIYLRI